MSDDADDKVIHSFSERLVIDQALRSLADAPNSYERERRARQLAEQGTAIIPAFLRHLDSEHAGMRGGLGMLAQYLDRATISAALRRVAADSKRSPIARVNAITILERYLDEDIEAHLAPDVHTARAIARQNAEEALQLAQSQPMVYVEYAEQLLDEPLEIIHAVVRVITEIEDPHTAFLLAAIAAQAPSDVVHLILRHLGTIRHQHSYAALSVLAHLLPSDLQAIARRQMRKLRMAGVSIDESLVLRCLWSPVSAGGQSMVWFIRQQPLATTAQLLIAVLHNKAGVLHVEANPEVPVDELPYPAPAGHEHHLRVHGATAEVYLAELTPAQGLDMLAQALHPQAEIDLPWPEELVVYGHWLWMLPQYEAAAPAWPALPAAAATVTADDVEQLLTHHACKAWTWTLPWDEATWQKLGLEEALQRGSAAHQAAQRLLVQDDVATSLQQRLQQQALWLTLVNQTALAAIALACAEAVKKGEIDHPFVVHFAWRSLLTAAADRAARTALRLIK